MKITSILIGDNAVDGKLKTLHGAKIWTFYDNKINIKGTHSELQFYREIIIIVKIAVKDIVTVTKGKRENMRFLDRLSFGVDRGRRAKLYK